MTRRRLMRELGEDELSEWLAVDRIHPLPDPYWCAALTASTTARAFGAKGARLEHFLPRRGLRRGADGRAIVATVAAVVRSVEQNGRNAGRT